MTRTPTAAVLGIPGWISTLDELESYGRGVGVDFLRDFWRGKSVADLYRWAKARGISMVELTARMLEHVPEDLR